MSATKNSPAYWDSVERDSRDDVDERADFYIKRRGHDEKLTPPMGNPANRDAARNTGRKK